MPLNFGFDYEYDEATGKLTLWFHSAPRGRKLDAIRAAAGGRLPVAFTMQTDCEVVAGRTTCNWGETFKSIGAAMARRHWSRIWMNAATACRR